MIGNLIKYFIFKSFLKKIILGIVIFVFAYFGLEDLSILQSAIGVTEYEVTKQIDIEVLNTEMKSTRVIKYRVSNIGVMPISLKLKIGTSEIKPDFELGDVFKIYSNTADPRLVKVTSQRPYRNRLNLNIEDLRPGLGLEIIFPDKRKYLNYLDQLDIKLDISSIPTIFVHKLNRSPFSIMLARYSMLLLICLSTAAIIYSLFRVGVDVLRE